MCFAHGKKEGRKERGREERVEEEEVGVGALWDGISVLKEGVDKTRRYRSGYYVAPLSGIYDSKSTSLACLSCRIERPAVALTSLFV